MPRIDEMPEYRANLPKSVHDLSHKFGFTATVAHLLPVFHDLLNPGETIELGFNYNLRTQPLQSAAMVDIKSHVEYFFVPMPLLYEPFGSMFYNIKDQYSSFYPQLTDGSVVPSVLPVFDFDEAHTSLLANWNHMFGGEGIEIMAARLLMHFGMNTYSMDQPLDNYNRNPSVFPYQFLAYHCIYQYYYRLDTRERFNQHTFNWDSYYNTVHVAGSWENASLLFQLHRRPKDSDYFTDVKVSPIVDVLNLNVKDNLQVANNWLSRNVNDDPVLTILSSGSLGASDSLYNSDAPTGDDYNNPKNNIQSNFGFRSSQVGDATSEDYIPINGQDINTANIRAMFATEKLWSITGRAKKHYDDQTLAHFGFKVPHDVKHEISCFGHDRGLIHIGEVISTADTANAALGEIAGKGYGNLQSQVHKFTAPCHGVVMAILSFVPDVTYEDTYLKANSVTSVNDLYQPEYDHLGMQPLFGYEGSISEYDSWTNIIGWQYRYEQWKRRFNRVSPAFGSLGPLRSWMLTFAADSNPIHANSNSYQNYHHHPRELDQIMLVPYVIQWTSGLSESKIYEGDPFIIDGFVHAKKVSTMSDYSLPRLDA